MVICLVCIIQNSDICVSSLCDVRNPSVRKGSSYWSGEQAQYWSGSGTAINNKVAKTSLNWFILLIYRFILCFDYQKAS